VTLITLHAAKGLEFPVVFMVGMEEGLLPYARALDDERELEEERRLTYVGMTRAKDRLYLVHARHRSAWGSGGVEVEPSRFLADLPEDLLEVGAGRRGSGLGWVRDRATRDGGMDDEVSYGPMGNSPSYWGRIRPGLEPLRPERLPDLAVPDRPALDEPDLGSGTFEAPAARTTVAATDLAWHAGDKVRHRRFGTGIVVSSQWVSGDEEVTVAFEGQGVRRLIGSYAGLERI
jgi:DNA helicase-2/ATP-dependent DNA helicase PcrA